MRIIYTALLFVDFQDGTKFEIKSLPGVYRWGVDMLEEALEEPVKNGLQSVLLFGVVSVRLNLCYIMFVRYVN